MEEDRILFYGSADEAFGAGAGLMADNGWWGLNKGWATNFESALQAYNGGKFYLGMVTGYYRQNGKASRHIISAAIIRPMVKDLIRCTTPVY
ncbi:MAG: hypothetical protein IPI98_08455 [Chitinophagaceae bacterium]|nr:hypothetical protein [Chitinophagaceae bacterium]